MKKFTFRLETLLRLNKQSRDQRAGELAEAHRVDDTLRQQIEAVGAQLDAIRDYCRRAASPGAVNLDRLVEAQRFEIALSGQQRNLQKQRDAVAEQIELRRKALVEADREVRVLEKLREQKADDYRRLEDSQEAKRLDEVASVQAFRARAIIQSNELGIEHSAHSEHSLHSAR